MKKTETDLSKKATDKKVMRWRLEESPATPRRRDTRREKERVITGHLIASVTSCRCRCSQVRERERERERKRTSQPGSP